MFPQFAVEFINLKIEVNIKIFSQKIAIFKNTMINYLKNTNFIALTIILSIFNLGVNSSLVEAKPEIKTEKSVSKLSFLETYENRSLSINLFWADDFANKIKQINLEPGDFELLSREKITPPQNSSVIASSFGGKASWYGPGFHGRLTANGERYNQNAMTAAHPHLKFGTKVKVTNLNNGRSVIVRINDRGPFVKGRVIDLSAAAARSLNMIHSGVAPVKVTILGQ